MSDSFIMYRSFHEALAQLSDEEYGQMMRIINEYALNGKVPENCTGLKYAVFTLIKPQIDANAEKHQKYNKAVETGKKGGKEQSINRKEVLELLNSGIPVKEIADKISCSRQAVYQIINEIKEFGKKHDETTDKKETSNEIQQTELENSTNKTLNSTNKTLNSTNKTLNSTNKTLNSTNKTLNSTNKTLNSTNKTLNSTNKNENSSQLENFQQTINVNENDNLNSNDNVNLNLNVNDDEDESGADKNAGPGNAEKSSSSFFTPSMVQGRLSALGVNLSENDMALVASFMNTFLPGEKHSLDYLDFLIEKARASYKADAGSERNWIHWYLTVDFKHNMYKENLADFDAWQKLRLKKNSEKEKALKPFECPSCRGAIMERMPGTFYCKECDSIIEFNPKTNKWEGEKRSEESLANFKRSVPIPEEIY